MLISLILSNIKLRPELPIFLREILRAQHANGEVNSQKATTDL